MFKRVFSSGICALGVALLGLSVPGPAHAAPPTVSRSVTPNNIGIGSAARMTFAIINTGTTVVTDMAFAATLPPGVQFAAIPNATTSCGGSGGNVSPDLDTSVANTFSFSNSDIGAGSSCTVSVSIVAAAAGVYTLPATTLTSSETDVSAPATDLTVVTTKPVFSLAAAPAALTLGDTTTLTFTMDNTANSVAVGSLDFTATLPTGLQVASPTNASTDCVAASSPDTTFAPVSGGQDIVLDANGFSFSGFESLPAGASCTATVDVIATGIGDFTVTAPSLLADFVDVGSAAATIQATAPDLIISATVLNTPVNAGTSAEVEFTILNRSRTDSATSVGFESDPVFFSPVISGMTATEVSNTCGGSVSDGPVLTLTGGSIAPEGSCTVRADFGVPAATAGGTYAINATTAVSGTIGGTPVTGNTTDAAFVVPAGGVAPIITLEFLEAGTLNPNPTPAPGDDVVLRMSITNGSSTSPASDVEVNIEMAPPLPFPVTATFPTTPCGAGSNVSSSFPDTDKQGFLLFGGSLTAFPAIDSTCSFDTTITLPSDISPGDYAFTSTGVTATFGGTPFTGAGASATLTVGDDLNLSFAKSFLSSAVPGQTVDMELAVTNATDGADAAAIAFSDDVNAMLAGTTVASVVSDGCGGTPTGTGTGLFGYSGGTLAANLSCSVVVRLNIPSAATSGAVTNTTSALTATPSGGGATSTFAAASANLTITNVTFAKEFIPSTVVPGEVTTLRYTIANNGSSNVSAGVFTDSMSTALSGLAATGTVTDPCGAGSAVSGTTFLIATGLNLLAGTTCTFDVPVLVPAGAAAGTYGSTTSSLTITDGGTITVAPAAASFTVEPTQIELVKEFTDDPVVAGDTVNLRYTVSNLSGLGVTGVAFSDDLTSLPSGTLFDATTSDGCSATIAGTGTSTVDISAIDLAASASCVIDVAITVPGSASSGSFVSTTSDLTGTIATTNPGPLAVTGAAASDTLVVNDLALTFTKVFSPDTLVVGNSTTVTYTIQNISGSPASGLSFSDDLGTAIPGAALTNLQTDCTGASFSGTSLLTFSGGGVAGSSSCTATVNVAVPVTVPAGLVTSTTSPLQSSGLEVAPAASDDVTFEAGADVSITATDNAISANAGETLVYNIVVTNNGPSPDPAVVVSNIFPATLSCTYSSTPAGGATGNTASATGNISDTLSMPSGSSVTYGALCSIPFTAAAGALVNTATVTGSIFDPDTGNNAATDNDTVVVPAVLPTFTKAFSTSPVAQGGTSQVTLTIDNAATPFSATSLDLTDPLPAGMILATPSNAFTSCTGGTLSATDGASVVTYTGGTVSGASSCTVTFDVLAQNSGNLVNTTGDLTSAFGNSGSASATLTVTPAPAPIFTKEFTPDSIEVGGVTSLAIEIDNSAALIPATGGGFSVTLPPSLIPATPPNPVASCISGSSVIGSYIATSNSVTLTGLNIAAGDTCTFGGDLQAINSQPSSITSTTTELVTSLGSSGTASDTLTITSGPAPTITGAFSTDPVDPGATTTLTFTLTNNSTLINATNAAFTATLPSNMFVASPASEGTTCTTGTVTASGTSISLASGTLPINGSCTVTANVTTIANNTTQTVTTSTLATSVATSAAGASVDLTVNAATEPVMVKSFAPNAITQAQVSTLTYAIMNGAGIQTGPITISETLSGGAVLANPINVNGDCTGATTTASAGDAAFALTGFNLGPSESCEVTVDVTSLTVGTTTTATAPLVSDIGGATPTAATLATAVAPAPTVAVDFDLATVVQGGTATLTIDISNTAALDANNLAFSDMLPTGMAIGTSFTPTNSCGGAFTAAGLSGGALLAGASCQITLPVVPTVTGTNTYEVNATSDLGTSAPASDSIDVTAAPVPTLTASFAPPTIEQGGASILTIFIENSTALVDATDVTVNLSLLTGLEEEGTGSFTTDCVGLTQASAAALDFTGGTVAAQTDCSMSINIRAVEHGSFAQPTGDVVTSLGTSPSIDANLTVNPANALGYTIAINPTSITQGNSAAVTVTLNNSANFIAAADAAFSVALGGTMQVAPVADPSTTCTGGSVSAVPGTSTASLSGGSVGFGQSCEVTFNVTSFDTGAFTATLGNLTTDVANTAGGATAALTVGAAPAPEFQQSYSPSTIGQGATSRLMLTIDNRTSGLPANQSGAPVANASGLGFDVTLPTGLTIEPVPGTTNSCGGSVTAEGFGSTVSLMGGAVAAGSTCTVAVDVTSTTEGTLGAATGSMSSSLGGASLAAPATPVVVTSNPFGSVTFVQNSVLDGTFNFASTEPSFTFDLAVSGGSASYGPVSVDAGTYSVTQTRPSGLTNATLVCSDANSVVDVITGSVSLVIDDGDIITCTWGAANSIEDTVEAINSFLQRRNNLILSNGPSAGRRMARLNQGLGKSRTLRFQNGDLASATPFTFDFTSIGSGSYKFSTSLQQVERSRRMFMLMVDGVENNVEVYTPPRWDIWFEATFAEFSASQSDGHFAVAHLGADYLVNDDLLLGFAVQYDSMDQGDDGGPTVEGTGWMAGPYVTARIAENLIFDGRIAYGRSSNTYDPKTTYIDKFDSDRFLIEATLSGNFDWEDWVVTPNFSLAYIEDTAESYVNGLGQTIPEQTVSLGQVRFGPTFSTTFEGRNQTVISPTFSVNAIYNFAETDGVTLVNDTSEESDGFRARIEAGIRITGRSGVQFEAGAHYDGIGQSDYESFGARLRVVVPLN